MSTEKFIRKGDVLVNSTGTGTLGRVAQVKSDHDAAIVDSHITIVRPIKGLFDDDFFGYAMISIEEAIAKEGDGCGGQIELSRNTLKNFEISFPKSHTDQQRIVAILNEAFAAIDKAKANAERNLKNARELFESYLQEIFQNKGESWKKTTLGEEAFVKSGGTPARAKKEYWEGNIPWFSSGELNELYTHASERKVNELAVANSNAKIFPKGSLLIGMYDTAALKMSILDREATFNQAIAGVKPNDRIDLLFVLHSINSIKPDLLNQRRGVRQKNLSLEKIKAIPLFIPPLSKQKEIVSKLSRFSTETKKLELIYNRKIVYLQDLKKSLLQKAFSGELTASKSIAKVIELPVKYTNISAIDLQAGIVAFALQRHLEANKANTFGHVKAEKIVHLAEQMLNIDLERNPVKDAAGPNDFPHANKVQFRAGKAGFYNVRETEVGYKYTPGNQIQSIISKTQTVLDEKVDKLKWLVDLLVPMTTQQAEIIATVYAAWNNLLRNGKEITDEAIVTEAREDWHPDKLKIERGKFFNAIKWIKEVGLVPSGNGKQVLAKAAK